MISANELRIGNLINLTDGDLSNQIYEDLSMYKVTADHITADHIAMCQYFNYDFNKFHKPIPITDEWILKCGFEIYYGQIIYKVYRLGLRFISEYDGKYYMQLGTGMNIEIKYVHQLQNLYFALTHTELTLK